MFPISNLRNLPISNRKSRIIHADFDKSKGFTENEEYDDVISERTTVHPYLMGEKGNSEDEPQVQ